MRLWRQEGSESASRRNRTSDSLGVRENWRRRDRTMEELATAAIGNSKMLKGQ